jgi:DNA-binding NarL/FixJ family response regulator
VSATTLLLVDDETTSRELMARGLRRAGFAVTTASDGREAAKLLAQPFDFVVTDLVMPHADGLALLDEMNRRGHAALRVVVTSFADKERVIAVLNLGAHYLLEKPFSVEQLARVLEQLREDRRADPNGLTRFFQRRLDGLPLTAREREIVGLLLQGDSNKQIARKLGLGEQTVKNSLSNVYARLRVQSRGELFHAVFPI